MKTAALSKLRVQSFSVSRDGYSAGPNQSLQHPLGVRGPELMDWFFPTAVFQKNFGKERGETGTDNSMAEQGFEGIGAWILGRNMFGPEYLSAKLIDELHLALRPILMGTGENLWNGLDLHALGYECVKSVAGERAIHLFIRKRS